MKIKEFYLESFPDDELGQDINPEATFEGLFETLDRYRDAYDYIGVGDSLVRERCFEKLAELMQCDYSIIYDQWLAV